jgi:DNA-binding LacI/PurR family transcriptional regulator
MNLLSNAAEASLTKGYALVLLPPDPQYLSPMRFPIDGVIVIDPLRDDPVLKVLRAQSITTMTIGRDLSGNPEPWVDDDIPSGVSALLELIAQPDDRIALVTFPATKSYLQDTISGVMAWPGHSAGYPTIHTINSTEADDVRLVTARLLTDRPDLLLGANDRITLALLRELTAAGLDVPGDIRLASLVDAPELERTNPTITALAQHPAEAARRAVDVLIENIAGKSVPAATRIPMRVAARASAPTAGSTVVRPRTKKPATARRSAPPRKPETTAEQ